MKSSCAAGAGCSRIGATSTHRSRGSSRHGRLPDPILAEAFYRKSLAKYDQAYRIRFGHYPGINKATLLLILGSLTPPPLGSQVRAEVYESGANWPASCWAIGCTGPVDQPDDLDRVAPGHGRRGPPLAPGSGPKRPAGIVRHFMARNSTPLARDSMRRQAERILMCFRNLSVANPHPSTTRPRSTKSFLRRELPIVGDESMVGSDT